MQPIARQLAVTKSPAVKIFLASIATDKAQSSKAPPKLLSSNGRQSPVHDNLCAIALQVAPFAQRILFPADPSHCSAEMAPRAKKAEVSEDTSMEDAPPSAQQTQDAGDDMQEDPVEEDEEEDGRAEEEEEVVQRVRIVRHPALHRSMKNAPRKNTDVASILAARLFRDGRVFRIPRGGTHTWQRLAIHNHEEVGSPCTTAARASC